MNEKHLSLFTPISEGLPEDKTIVMFILKKGNEIKLGTFNKGDNFYIKPSFKMDIPYLLEEVLCWLDLSKLTTIEKAKEAIEKCANETYKHSNSIEYTKDIAERYKNTL